MRKTDIDFSAFVQYVHEKFKENISYEEVEDTLYLDEGYDRDNPISSGKFLLLNRLVFLGEKNSGKDFQFDQRLYNGVNVWIADNQKGKSTIFKIIKYALTGTNSIKRDISSWIHQIMLEFQIGRVSYTVHIDRSGRDKGAMYRLSIDEIYNCWDTEDDDKLSSAQEFEFRNRKRLEENLQEFFFDHFAFYTLEYTQKSSVKSDLELKAAHLSWSTYFKSIYLESSNYEYLFFDNERFGAQGKKIFEMILGLPLTYPINMLTIKRDKVVESIAKIKLTDKSNSETAAANKKNILDELASVSEKLKTLSKTGNIRFDEKPLITEYNSLQERINNTRKKQRIANDDLQNEKRKEAPLAEELENLKQDRRHLESELIRLTKQELELELYAQAESFFSNLDIKECPHCETEVSTERKETERSSHVCSLCGESSTEQRVDGEELAQKAARIKEEKSGHQKKLQEIKITISQQQKGFEQLQKSITEKYNSVIAIPSVDAEVKRLAEIENRIENIRKEREQQKALLESRDELMRKEAVLKFQLSEIEKTTSGDNSAEMKSLMHERDILEYALVSLERKRGKLNIDILDKLKKLILSEVNAFGVTSIEEIEISDKYELSFIQNNVKESFSDLSEGEKLRVKLAFYLSLVQLDIEHNLGRHPRFLIFDSPGKEEMVPKHLNGLAEILKDVNDRLQDHLQIFIGSALREFAQITDAQKTLVKEEDEPVF